MPVPFNVKSLIRLTVQNRVLQIYQKERPRRAQDDWDTERIQQKKKYQQKPFQVANPFKPQPRSGPRRTSRRPAPYPRDSNLCGASLTPAYQIREVASLQDSVIQPGGGSAPVRSDKENIKEPFLTKRALYSVCVLSSITSQPPGFFLHERVAWDRPKCPVTVRQPSKRF